MTPEQALAAVVAGEDAAVYAYGLVGGRLPVEDRDLARAAIATHRQRRDRARGELADLGAAAPPAAVAYDPPFPVVDEPTARALAALVENRLAAVYADLAAATAGTRRTDAVLAARESAVRAVAWGGTPQAFPGASDG